MEFSADGLAQVEALLWPLFAVFLRIGAMVFVLPAFGEQAVPGRIRLGIAAALTAIVYPAVLVEIGPAPESLRTALSLGLAEIVAGLFFGLMLRLFVISLQIAGTIAAQSVSVSQIFGAGPGAEPQPAMSNVLLISGLALIALLGLHVHVVAYILEGYELFPARTMPSPSVVAQAGLEQVGTIFALAFTLAAPFLIASVLYNVVLGVINRAMPQLMVAFVGAPAITAAGLFLLFVSAPYLLDLWADAFLSYALDPAGAA